LKESRSRSSIPVRSAITGRLAVAKRLGCREALRRTTWRLSAGLSGASGRPQDGLLQAETAPVIGTAATHRRAVARGSAAKI
jgi:hypothetical protein